MVEVVVEAGLLSVLGGALGLLLAYWIIAAVHSLPAGTIPRAESIEMRWSVLLVLALIATVTTVLSALLPALFIARIDAQTALRAGSRSLGNKSFKTRVGGWLVGAEVALSALLLIAAGLLFRTLWDLEHTRLGFATTNLSSFVAMPADNSTGASPASVATMVYQPLLDGLHHTPGFQDAALVSEPPFSGLDFETSFGVIGRPRDSQQGFQNKTHGLSGRYEEVMGTPVIRGGRHGTGHFQRTLCCRHQRDAGAQVFRRQRSLGSTVGSRRRRDRHAETVHHRRHYRRSDR